MLIHAPVPLYRRADGTLMLDGQACTGLRLWAANFERVMAILPVADALPGKEWVPIEQVGESLARIEFVPVPVAYRPDRFLAALPAARRAIRAAIGKADYLSFAIGGLFGDWGSVACFEAHRMRRPYAVWTDRVESEVVRLAATGDGPWRVRLRARLTRRPMAWLERAVIRRAEVGLFHGRETYDAYAPFCRHPEVVHDIAISTTDHIAPEALAAKQAATGAGPLRHRLCRAGPIAMKGPHRLGGRCWSGSAAAGCDFRAVWLGDGESSGRRCKRRSAGAGSTDRVIDAGLRDRPGRRCWTALRRGARVSVLPQDARVAPVPAGRGGCLRAATALAHLPAQRHACRRGRGRPVRRRSAARLAAVDVRGERRRASGSGRCR